MGKESTTTAAAANRRRWIAMGVVFVATFMVLLDVTIVMVAVPSIQRQLHATYAEVQLTVALYLVAYAVCLIVGGRLGDLLGRRRMFMTGVAGFIVASAFCGLAPSPEALLGARLVQGITAALMYPQALAYAQVLFPPAERNRVFAVFGAVIGVAALSGQLLGGALIQWNAFGLDWRLIFLVNIPVGLLALVAAPLLLPESRAATRPRLDIGGLGLSAAALLLLVWPLVEGREAGWPLWSYISLVGVVPAFVLFVAYEHRVARRGRAPLIDVRLFHHASFSLGLLTVLALLAGIPSLVLTLTLFIQGGLGFGALHSGLTVAPFMGGFLAGSFASTRLVARFGINALVGAAIVMTVGMGLVVLGIDRAGTTLSGPELVPEMLLAGVGAGAVVSQIFRVVVSAVEPHQAGAASGVLATAQQIGSALGIAIVGVIFFGALGAGADSVVTASSSQLQTSLVAAGLPDTAAGTALQQFRVCFDARARASDPTQVPAVCPRPATGSAVADTLAAAGRTDLAVDMHRAIVIALRFNVATWVVALALLCGFAWLHRRAHRRAPATPATAVPAPAHP
jgi:EmrB/QacA subfamily drug resistance transporter